MKQMGVREFLRGGYRTITEPTLVSRHSRTLFTVMPHGDFVPCREVMGEEIWQTCDRERGHEGPHQVDV